MNTFDSNQRNTGIDLLKGLCTFLIICLHADFYGKLHVDTLARIAVPLFFIITGYYYTITAERKRTTGQIKKIFFLTIFSILFFIGWDMLTNLIQHKPLQNAWASWKDLTTWTRLLFFNFCPNWTHIWYLSALLYALIILFIADKIGSRQKLYSLIPILLIANLLLGNYSTLIFHREIPLYFSRNYLFMGLPFLLLGDFIYEYRRKIKISNKFLLFILIFSLFTTYIERKGLTYFNAYDNKDFFVSTTFTALALFLLVLNNPQWFQPKLVSKLASLEKRLALSIYILHPAVILVVNQIVGYLGKSWLIIHTVYFYSSPMIIMLVSTGVGLILWHLSQWLKELLSKFHVQSSLPK